MIQLNRNGFYVEFGVYRLILRIAADENELLDEFRQLCGQFDQFLDRNRRIVRRIGGEECADFGSNRRELVGAGNMVVLAAKFEFSPDIVLQSRLEHQIAVRVADFHR